MLKKIVLQLYLQKFVKLKMYDINDYKDLYEHISDKLNLRKTYLLLDEVQNFDCWEKAINSLKVHFDVDIYITGSNAYLLSSELSALLSGGYIEIKMYPLSFEEYLIIMIEQI